jgi:catechol 2,3-dioxygenase-like lactoylglutathione lyase family enzyme
MTAAQEPGAERFDVGGYWQPRPFRVTRLGHVGLNCVRFDESLHLYRDLLGFRTSDRMDFKDRRPDPEVLEGLGDTGGYFMRHATDHHSFVLFNKQVIDAVNSNLNRAFRPGITVNQISWQVGTLNEVVDGEHWLRAGGRKIQRAGRDMPGSNWHTYFYDVDGHTNELYCGMEQLGWQASSKPLEFYQYMLRETAKLPQISETEEVNTAIANGVDLNSGQRNVAVERGTYDVGGVLATRPFKITKIGPLRLFVDDIDAAVAFYRDVLGLRITEEIGYEGLRCVLLRAGTEHHTIGLYPIELRDRLGLSPHSTTFSVAIQVGGYRQLRDARRFLLEHGLVEEKLPPELFPGLSRAFRFRDPDGHVVELYDGMRQVIAAPAAGGTAGGSADFGDEWPETVEDDGIPFLGEPFLGPVE